GRCRLSIAVPEGFAYEGPDDLNGLRVATSYPDILQRFLDEKGVRADIREISGSAEIAPSIGLAEAVCDLVSSGSTLMSTRLKEVEVIMESQAVLVAGKNLDAEKRKVVDRLIMRIRSAQEAKNCRYVSLNAPTEKIAELARILPGMRSPTVVPLAESGWSAMHSVIADCDFWELIEQLKDAGAEGILVLPIEKMFLSPDCNSSGDRGLGAS
ncbi:UNVERIFIED_CONTAM: hypothetical protein GTU68_005865, partial [Idotea baltica]|nr:hypothetical protein [Idotea baltica]